MWPPERIRREDWQGHGGAKGNIQFTTSKDVFFGSQIRPYRKWYRKVIKKLELRMGRDTIEDEETFAQCWSDGSCSHAYSNSILLGYSRGSSSFGRTDRRRRLPPIDIPIDSFGNLPASPAAVRWHKSLPLTRRARPRNITHRDAVFLEPLNSRSTHDERH